MICHDCQEIILVKIARYVTISSSDSSRHYLSFHEECFIRIAGEEYLPPPKQIDAFPEFFEETKKKKVK
jgi:hypothetical protein